MNSKEQNKLNRRNLPQARQAKLTGRPPFGSSYSDSSEFIDARQNQDIEPQIPSQTPPKLKSVLQSCVTFFRFDRTHIDTLKKDIETLNIPWLFTPSYK